MAKGPETLLQHRRRRSLANLRLGPQDLISSLHGHGHRLRREGEPLLRSIGEDRRRFPTLEGGGPTDTPATCLELGQGSGRFSIQVAHTTTPLAERRKVEQRVLRQSQG
eukprot:1202044-Pyramimonas_sp.AAC.1